MGEGDVEGWVRKMEFSPIRIWTDFSPFEESMRVTPFAFPFTGDPN